MTIKPLSPEQLQVFLAYFPTLTLRFFCNTGAQYRLMDVAAPKMLNHLHRLQGCIALLTLEGQKEDTTQHSPRYGLDVSAISTAELEWVLAVVVRRERALIATQQKEIVHGTCSLNHGDRSQWSYWQAKRFAMAPAELRHAVFQGHHHGQPDSHGRQYVEEPRPTPTRAVKHRGYTHFEPAD